MNKIRHQDLQRQITNLIPLVEMSIPLIEEIDQSKNKLNTLPTELDNLKQQLNFLQLESSPTTPDNSQNVVSPSQIEETDLKLDFIVDDLEEILAHLTTFDRQIRNVISLKERLEAVQEERIGNFTPERIYRLLERRREQTPQPLDNTPSTKTNPFNDLWQKVVKYKYSKPLAISTALTLGIVSFFSVVSYSAMNQQSTENNTAKEIKESSN